MKAMFSRFPCLLAPVAALSLVVSIVASSPPARTEQLPSLPANSSAADGTSSPSPSLPFVRLDTQHHLLQAGDQLSIDIFSLPDLPRLYEIRADGVFYHSLAGDIPAAGKTLKQVHTLLQKRLRKELRDSRFRLGLHSLAKNEVAVLGEVRQAGKFQIAPGTTLLDLLAQVGGLTSQADTSAILMRGQQQIPVSLRQADQLKASGVVLKNGDILYVLAGRRIGVSGEVYTSGVYAVGVNSDNPVRDAIRAAGGAKETAALNRVAVIKPTQEKPVLVNLLDPASSSAVLEDGDTIQVPARVALLMGAVSKQGALPIKPDESLVDVITESGVNGGQLDHIVVVRAADVLAGNAKKEEYNLDAYFKEENKDLPHVSIHDGDLIYVPKTAEGTNAQGWLGMLVLARSLLSF